MLCKSVLFYFVLLFSAVSSAGEARLSVVTSIRPLALLVQDLAGEWVDVEVLVPPNVDPHNMSLKPSARSKLNQADLVLWLGPEFERFLVKPMRQRKSPFDISVETIKGVFEKQEGGEFKAHIDAGYSNHHERDLHVWLNPKKAQLILNSLADHLLELRPGLKDVLARRLAWVLMDIKAIYGRIKNNLLPYDGKTFGVYHDAYGHFAEAFGLDMVAAVNQMPEQRIGAKHMHQLQKSMVNASCMVVERKSAKTERLARVLKVKQVEADPLASDDGIKSYKAFLLYLGSAFEACFEPAI